MSENISYAVFFLLTLRDQIQALVKLKMKNFFPTLYGKKQDNYARKFDWHCVPSPLCSFFCCCFKAYIFEVEKTFFGLNKPQKNFVVLFFQKITALFREILKVDFVRKDFHKKFSGTDWERKRTFSQANFGQNKVCQGT